MGNPIHAVTATQLTSDQITSTKARAALAGDDRLVCLCNEAEDQTGDTPARKVVTAKVNETRKWLASRLGVDFIEAAPSVAPPTTESKNYGNVKVDALLAGHISISGGTFTSRDFIALALAALDQAGVSVSLQRRVNELVADEIEDAQLHVQPCRVDDGAPCHGCELMNAKAVG